MSSAAKVIFERIATYQDCLDLVTEGEAEGLYLECKAPSSPRFNKGQKAKLAEALSGFANTAGGVLLWGAGTTPQKSSGLDVITEIEPIGAVRSFAQAVDAAIPTLTVPPVLGAETKVILEAPRKARGVALTLIPQAAGDPIQSTEDYRFHFRSGDQFTILPYSLLKRMFAASDSPDLLPNLIGKIVKQLPNGTWDIPIALHNQSSAVAEHAVASVLVENPDACSKIEGTQAFKDVSDINPGQRLFLAQTGEVIHRGLNIVLGSIRVHMKGRHRILYVQIDLFANRMRARSVRLKIQLAKTGFTVTELSSENRF